jgi:hypothetical protein
VTAPIAMNGNQNGAIWIWKGSGHDTAAMTAIGLLNRHAKRPVAYALFVSTACTPKNAIPLISKLTLSVRKQPATTCHIIFADRLLFMTVCTCMQNNSNHPDEAWLVDTLRQGDPLLTPTPQLKNYTNSTVRQLI